MKRRVTARPSRCRGSQSLSFGNSIGEARNRLPLGRREDNKPVINKLVRYSVALFTFPIAVFYAAYHILLAVSLASACFIRRARARASSRLCVEPPA